MITHKFKLIPLNILGETLPCNHGLLSKLFFQPSTISLELTQQFGV